MKNDIAGFLGSILILALVIGFITSDWLANHMKYVERQNFIEDCSQRMDRDECVQMWEQGND